VMPGNLWRKLQGANSCGEAPFFVGYRKMRLDKRTLVFREALSLWDLSGRKLMWQIAAV